MKSKKQVASKKVLLIDGSNLAFRMYFALERTGLTSPSGKPSWAIFGFFKILLDIIEKEKPDTLIAAFDRKEPTFRHEAFDFYKANRPDEMPEALALQWPEIKRGLNLIGMNIIELAGYEADDLIGTLALQAENSNWEVLILSGDRDNFQLVNDKVKILMPIAKGGSQLIGRDEVKVKMGIYPEQVIDFKALAGDSSDNIPGVAGIGEKTAVKLLEEFGDLAEIYKNIDKVSSASLRKKLLEGAESAKDSKYLATIKTDCQIVYDFDNSAHKLKPQLKDLVLFLREYKLASLEKNLPVIFEKFGIEELLTSGEKKELIFKNFDELHKEAIKTAPINIIEQKSKAEKPNIIKQIIYEKADLENIITEIKNNTSSLLALDLETTGLNTFTCNIVGWALAFKTTDQEIKSVYIPTTHNYLGVPEQLSNEFVSVQIKNLINQKTDLQLIIQNTKFEYKILSRFGITLPENTVDTMLASYIENPDQSHGLKNQTLRVFGYQMALIDELIGAKGKNQKTMDQVDIDLCGKYACDDSAFTLALYEYYEKTLSEKELDLWLKVESPLAVLLSQIELRGVFINADKLKALSDELFEKINQAEKSILEKLDCGFINLNSPQQLGIVLEKKGFKLTKTLGGQASTDGKVLNELLEQDETGLIKEIINYRGFTKLKSTYTDALPRQINTKTNRLHCEFNQALTSTGRLSSSNPNLQNIPVKSQGFGKGIRAAFEAENGNILICADYSQIELRFLAHYTQDPTLLDAFQNGQDIHQRTASEIFEISTEEVSSEQRRLGKTLNFALVYQQGAFATAKQLGISRKEADQFIEKYFKSFTQIKPFIEKTLEQARENGFVETLWGRKRYFANLNSKTVLLRKLDERAAFNAPLQGSAADLIKKAMLLVKNEIQKQNLKADLILQVHDEIILETPIAQADQVMQILLDKMSVNQPLLVPVEIQIAKGFNWAECK